MNIVDGVLLVVCACEGPMTQTKFVLSKAIENNAKPIVVMNKVDRPAARVEEVESEIFDLFLDLDLEEKFVDYPVFYTSAKEGWALDDWTGNVPANAKENSMVGIVDKILAEITEPEIKSDENEGFSLLISQIEHNPYHGRVVKGKVSSGKINIDDPIDAYNQDGKLIQSSKISKIYKSIGLKYTETQSASAGEIIMLTGLDKAGINDVVCSEGFKDIIKVRFQILL